MARSRRHSPFSGWTLAKSEAVFKRQCHKRERAAERVALRVAPQNEHVAEAAEVQLKRTEIWNGPKDGKVPIDPNGPYMRK
jgi:pyridoxine 5'-phosphate synthase PdxJ